MKIDQTRNLMIDYIMREKYSPVARFDPNGQLQHLNPASDAWDEGFTPTDSQGDPINTQRVEPRSSAPTISPQPPLGIHDEGSAGRGVDPIKGGVANIPASLGGWGNSIGNLLDIFA